MTTETYNADTHFTTRELSPVVLTAAQADAVVTNLEVACMALDPMSSPEAGERWERMREVIKILRPLLYGASA